MSEIENFLLLSTTRTLYTVFKNKISHLNSRYRTSSKNEKIFFQILKITQNDRIQIREIFEEQDPENKFLIQSTSF